MNYVARCALLASTGESRWSARISGDSPEQAVARAATAADTYADNLGISRGRIRLYHPNGDYLLEES